MKLEPESYACLVACYAQLGRIEEANQAAKEFADESGKGTLSVTEWREYWSTYLHFKDQASVDHLIEGLDKAGLVRS